VGTFLNLSSTNSTFIGEVSKARMDTGRVDPRVGSGRVTGQHQDKFGGSGRNFWNALFCSLSEELNILPIAQKIE